MRRTSTIGCMVALVGAAALAASCGGGATQQPVGSGSPVGSGNSSGGAAAGSSSGAAVQASGDQSSGVSATGGPGSGTASGSSTSSGTVASSGASTGGGSGAAASGGSSGTAGNTSGTVSSGGGGTSGAAAASGMSGAGNGRPSGPSAGCGKAPTEPFQMAVSHSLTVNVAPKYAPQYAPRKYCTTLPKNYDPTRAYPTVFWGNGCGSFACEGTPFSGTTFSDKFMLVQLVISNGITTSNVVPPGAAPGCFEAGKGGLVDSPEGPYFDQVLGEVEANYCLDKGKVFIGGSSSGAWLTNYLACARGNVISGGAADSGGLQHDHGTCTGGARVMEMPGDSTSSIVGGFDIGVGPARDTFIAANGCSTTTTNMTFGRAACQVYGGCAAPIAWCNVGGGHQSGVPFIADAAWAFWNMP